MTLSLTQLSVARWRDPPSWTLLFENAQKLLGAELTHLSTSDPVKRNRRSAAEAGSYACDFGAREDSRWLFGRFADANVGFMVHHHRELGVWPNRLIWTFPEEFASNDLQCSRVRRLLSVTSDIMDVFYAYCDFTNRIGAKKKPSGGIDVESELVGVFWLTYLNAAYVEFFGAEKFEHSDAALFDHAGSVTLDLAPTPACVPSQLRQQWEVKLGEMSFVNPDNLSNKRPGVHALRFEQLVQRVDLQKDSRG